MKNAFALAILLVTASALAKESPPGKAAAPPPPPINVVATPIFGTDAPVGKGWFDILVRIDNPQATAQKGTLELYDTTVYKGEAGVTTHAPFNVPPGKSAYVELESHGTTYGTPVMAVRAKDPAGNEIVNVGVTMKNDEAPVFVDIDEPSKLAIVMRGWPATVSYGTTTPLYYAGPTPATIAFTTPQFDHATGDPIMPSRAAGYGAATVVLVHSDMLARLQGPPLDALVNWIASGGTLAVIPNRPEDLRNPPLLSFAGGTITSGPPAPGLLTLPTPPKPSLPSTGPPPVFPEYEGWEPAPPKPSDFVPLELHDVDRKDYTFIRSSTASGPMHLGPRAAVAAKMLGYTGGSLRATVFGSSASYGLGEVHLLAFDPTAPPALDDPWVQGRLAAMVNHAWDRRAPVVLKPTQGPGFMPRKDEVRRALDPNENFRPALGFAAIVLAIYSIFVGPVIFLRARKRERPLMPLTWAPILSAAAFGSIVLAGLAVKGWRGRSRQIAIVETTGGFTRGAMRRYRGFFTSETRSLRIGALDPASVVDIVHFESALSPQDSWLSVDRDGLSVDKITSLPWQTLVVREDGFFDLKGPVSIWNDPAAKGPMVTNHTGKTLRDVIVYVPTDGARFFPDLADGASIESAKGQLLFSSSLRRATSAGTTTVHMLDSASLAGPLLKADADRVSATWHLVESSTDESADWWPDDAPVVLAEMADTDHAASDSGLRVESQRTLLRVVGFGGAK